MKADLPFAHLEANLPGRASSGGVKNDNRHRDRSPKQQAKHKRPPEWEADLNPNHLAGQNIGHQSDARVDAEWTAFHLRKRGMDLGGVNDEELRQVPIVCEGERLQQGATYVDLKQPPLEEFTARGDMTAGSHNAYVPKTRVPHEIWNRLTGEPKPRQE
jgi:hypothetical protein